MIENESVYNNVALSLKLIGIKDKNEIKKRVSYVLDRVGMLRYKNRPCNMLSGGERQRVGIARAIVKNPNIIIADEPTGNLDSKNSVEIMNIIKSISKDKLVILVTHEKNLAKFYATRIIELEDGKVIADYENEVQDELNYEILNNIYLKDFDYKRDYDNINVYSNTDEKIHLNIVVTGSNIYIETNSNKKIEVVDEDSSIEMIDDHYKNISKQEVDKYDFNFKEIINENKKIRYSSIFNPITFITNGYKKVLNYTLLKKLLLFGFFFSGMFILYATSTIKAALTVKDENFVEMNKNYLIVESRKIKLEDYQKLDNTLDKQYMLPGDSIVNLRMKIDSFYQFSIFDLSLTGSLSSVNMLKEDNLIAGRLPENENEIVVDQMVLKKAIKKSGAVNVGLGKPKDFINQEIIMDRFPNMIIVGISDLKSPSIYMYETKMLNVIYHTKQNSDNEDGLIVSEDYLGDDYYTDPESNMTVDNYELYVNDITLKEGRWPTNDYETIIPYSQKEEKKLNSEISKKVNDHKLKVVGYYESKREFQVNFVSYNTMLIECITKSKDITIYTKNKQAVMDKVKNEYNMTIQDSYKASKDSYIRSKREYVKSTIISAGIILAISLIEILLMIRSSFLSRVKEVGIYRAIGVKKKDIYIMFSGEIIAITTIASLPGILLMAYLLRILTKIEILSEILVVNYEVVFVSILLVFVFNLIVGLIPVWNTIRKRPAEILSRTDIS